MLPAAVDRLREEWPAKTVRAEMAPIHHRPGALPINPHGYPTGKIVHLYPPSQPGSALLAQGGFDDRRCENTTVFRAQPDGQRDEGFRAGGRAQSVVKFAAGQHQSGKAFKILPLICALIGDFHDDPKKILNRHARYGKPANFGVNFG